VIVTLTLLAGALTAYVLGVVRLRRRGDPWPAHRTAVMAGAIACLGAALLPPVGTHDELFPVHICQHLLVGMVVPVLLALSAPVTLLLRVLDVRTRRSALRVLHSRVIGWLVFPPFVVLLQAGSLSALYLTGLYGAAEERPWLHALLHLHMLAAGCLFAWVVVGVDPVPRCTLPVRLVTLTLVGATHDTLSKLMYAHDLPAGGGTLAERHLGAALLYYIDSAFGLVVAVVVMTQWWRSTGRSLEHAARRDRTSSRPSPSPGVTDGGAGPPGPR
jgi:putative membrane protein